MWMSRTHANEHKQSGKAREDATSWDSAPAQSSDVTEGRRYDTSGPTEATYALVDMFYASDMQASDVGYLIICNSGLNFSIIHCEKEKLPTDLF